MIFLFSLRKFTHYVDIFRSLINSAQLTNFGYFLTVDATGKKIRGQADGNVNDYDQYGK